MTVDTVPTSRSGTRRVIALTAGTIGVIHGYDPVSWLFIYRFAPETKGRQLEAIHEYWENGGVWPEPAERGSRTT